MSKSFGLRGRLLFGAQLGACTGARWGQGSQALHALSAALRSFPLPEKNSTNRGGTAHHLWPLDLHAGTVGNELFKVHIVLFFGIYSRVRFQSFHQLFFKKKKKYSSSSVKLEPSKNTLQTVKVNQRLESAYYLTFLNMFLHL